MRTKAVQPTLSLQDRLMLEANRLEGDANRLPPWPPSGSHDPRSGTNRKCASNRELAVLGNVYERQRDQRSLSYSSSCISARSETSQKGKGIQGGPAASAVIAACRATARRGTGDCARRTWRRST